VGTIPARMPTGSAIFCSQAGLVLDDAAGLFFFVLVVDHLRGKVIFDHLVLNDAHAGFLHGLLGQGDAQFELLALRYW
jgi:hypothetical protein